MKNTFANHIAQEIVARPNMENKMTGKLILNVARYLFAANWQAHSKSTAIKTIKNLINLQKTVGISLKTYKMAGK